MNSLWSRPRCDQKTGLGGCKLRAQFMREHLPPTDVRLPLRVEQRRLARPRAPTTACDPGNGCSWGSPKSTPGQEETFGGSVRAEGR